MNHVYLVALYSDSLSPQLCTVTAKSKRAALEACCMEDQMVVDFFAVRDTEKPAELVFAIVPKKDYDEYTYRDKYEQEHIRGFWYIGQVTDFTTDCYYPDLVRFLRQDAKTRAGE